MSRSLASLVAALTLAVASGCASTSVQTHRTVYDTPDATFTITGTVMALGVGYEWVRGNLMFQGRTYPFTVRGISVMDFGAAKITGAGEVFNLKSLADFEGNYAGSTFGSAVSSGQSLALIENERGVSLRARSAVSGVRFNFSGNGMRIRFVAQPDAASDPASGNQP